MNLEAIYLTMPVILQNTLISIEGIRLKKRRYGKEYEEIERQAFNRIEYTAREMHEYRARCLNMHMNSASKTAFWKRRFDEYGVDIISDDPFSELMKLPILKKEELKRHIHEIKNNELSSTERLKAHTSGTTGSGMQFYSTKSMEKITWATWWRYRKMHGIEKSDWCAYFGGRSIVPYNQKRVPYWRYNYPARQLMLSAYHLSEETAASYARAMVDARVKWIHGYPSMISLFADYVINQSLTVPALKIVTIGAENLLFSQKEKISKAFNTKVVQHYGQAEGVANISECPQGKLHVDEDYSHVEFITHESCDDIYRIVGTNWHNQAFPLFRYDTGDLATIAERSTCDCSFKGRIVDSIDGRQEDYVQLKNGVRIGRMDHVFKDMINVREAQIVQKNTGALKLRIVKGEKYNERDERELIKELEKRIGKELNVTIEYVEKIDRTKTGKLRFVIHE